MQSTRICRVGQNLIYAPYMTVYLVISMPKIPYIHRTYMVPANPTDMHVHAIDLCMFMQSTRAFSKRTCNLNTQHINLVHLNLKYVILYVLLTT